MDLGLGGRRVLRWRGCRGGGPCLGVGREMLMCVLKDGIEEVGGWFW
jgi:hypothetical protein